MIGRVGTFYNHPSNVHTVLIIVSIQYSVAYLLTCYSKNPHIIVEDIISPEKRRRVYFPFFFEMDP